jgi:hypothetical protein
MKFLVGTKHSIVWDPNQMSLAQVVEALRHATAKAEAFNPIFVHNEAQQRKPAAIDALTVEANLDTQWTTVNRFPHATFLALDELTRHEDSSMITQAIKLHQLYRYIAASCCAQKGTITSRIKKLFGVKLATRKQLLTLLDTAISSSSSDHHVEHALALFELVLAATSPITYQSDAWLLMLTQQPVPWLPVNTSTRLLHPHTLLTLLWGPLGQNIIRKLTHLGWSDSTFLLLKSISHKTTPVESTAVVWMFDTNNTTTPSLIKHDLEYTSID